MTRREFLRLCILAAGTTGVAAVALSRRGSAETSSSAAADSTHHHQPGHTLGPPNNGELIVPEFAHRGRRIRIVRRGNEVVMNLDGRDLPHHAFARVGTGFGSHLLAFREDRRPIELARALVDGDGLLFVL
jgi:hypothetical protein